MATEVNSGDAAIPKRSQFWARFALIVPWLGAVSYLGLFLSYGILGVVNWRTFVVGIGLTCLSWRIGFRYALRQFELTSGTTIGPGTSMRSFVTDVIVGCMVAYLVISWWS